MAQSNLIHADILSGAYELALRTAHWQGDQALSASGVDTWYALDVDVLNFYSNPKEHARYAALTGLLPELQRNAVNPALLGLAEMLGRFLFKDSERPNLLMDACAEEFLDIYEIVSRKYFAELSTTARNVPHALTVLQKLVATYLKARSESPRSFVAKVAAQLAETLPALYGQYNATREIERWAPLIAAASERLIPASRLDAMAEALDARFEADCKPQGLGWTEIQLHWQQAIEKTFPVGATAARLKKGAVDANAMAEVEWINRYFHHLNRPVRLVYVSGASRLFDASLLRFNAIKDHRLPPPPIGMIEQLTITRYFAMVEPVGQSSQSEALDPNWAPLRDIRCFLADPAFVDFVRFATPESSDAETAPTPPMEADLTKWLNVFLSGTADQHPAASEGYLVLHGLKVAKRLAKPQYSNESTSRLASQFPAAAYEELNRNWQKFAARVGAAHGIERGYRHKVVEDIVKVFQGQDAIAVLSAALDQEMSDVLVNVGNASLAGESAGVRAQGTPPLVLSRFSAVEALICDTISDNSDQKKLADRIVEIQNAVNSLNHADSHKKYLTLLSKAILFASCGSWGACLAFASQAYAIGKLDAVKQAGNAGDPITGREAAYLCHYAVRKRPAPTGWWIQECARWGELWQNANRVEKAYFNNTNQPELVEFHELRLAVERDALDLAVQFSNRASSANTALENASPVPASTATDSVAKNKMDRVLDTLSNLKGRENFGSASIGYRGSLIYVERQLLINLIQRILVLEDTLKDSDIEAVKKYALRSEVLSAGNETPAIGALRLSHFDKFIFQCAQVVAKTGANVDRGSIIPPSAMPYDAWKHQRLQRHLTS